MRFVMMGSLCAGVLVAIGCADGGGIPTSPSATLASATTLAAAPRSGELRVAKECSGYDGEAGSFCTITASNVQAIEVGSTILYLDPPALFAPSGTDIVLDPPGPGNNKAFGNCALDPATGLGLCRFSGGTGKFTTFSATANVTPPTIQDPVNWHWNGTYSFVPHD
jgi:hypothetical protein